MIKRKIPRFEIIVDQYNMQTLRALRIKLSRDYLAFFRSLSKLYGRSRRKREIDETIIRIRTAIAFLDNILIEGVLEKKDVKSLTGQLKELNEIRDYFLEQVENVDALREKTEKVRRETGISPKDLNITEKVIKIGVQQARKPVWRPSTLERFKERMPRTYYAGARILRGAGAAAFGPFAPLASLALLSAGEMLKLPVTVVGALRKRKVESLRRELRPVIGGLSTQRLRQMYAERGAGLGVTGFGRLRAEVPRPQPVARRRKRTKEEQVAPLVYFFDRKAYRAKWTRELLSRFKRFERKEKDAGLISSLLKGIGGLPGKFLKLSASIVPFLGKAGLLASLGASIGFTTSRLYKLAGVVASLWDVKKQVRTGAVKIGKTVAQRKEAIREMGLEKYAEKTGRAPAAVLTNIIAMEERARLQEEYSKPWYKRIFSKEPELKTSQEIQKRLEELKTEFGVRKQSPDAAASEAAGKQIVEEINKLSSAIKDLSQQVGRDKEVPAIKDTSIGNLYDSGDVLVNEHASGSLTLGGE